MGYIPGDIGKDYWGRVVATRTLTTILSQITDRPLHAYVTKQNAASIRVLQKCGIAFFAKATSALGEQEDGIEELVYVARYGSNSGSGCWITVEPKAKRKSVMDYQKLRGGRHKLGELLSCREYLHRFG